MTKFVSHVYKTGDSLVCVIPSSICEANDISKGDAVLLDVKKK